MVITPPKPPSRQAGWLMIELLAAIATTRNGKLWKIECNPADPLSRGRLCPRGSGGVGAGKNVTPR